MAEYKAQGKDIVYALDIGTRSVIGMVGKADGERFQVLDIEVTEHSHRAMMDGQIDNIQQVAALVRTVTERLEERLGVRLQRVCVAAAGRALRTQYGSFALDLTPDTPMSAEQISRLEAGAVSIAEEALLQDEEARQKFFLVGYTVAQYRLDNYPLSALQGHSGRQAEADVVATFLPGEVVESLYAVVRKADLQVASMTLEPIAAMNAAIPAELRLLNLALVDIGAGTTDIAVCRDGSVVGYTMATTAGDEITETLMRAYLVDFQTAERIKQNMRENECVTYTDILGLENTVSCQEIHDAIQVAMETLAEAISTQVIQLNGGTAPSAVFLAGGGSKLCGLQEKVAEHLKIETRRVAIAGNNFKKSAFANDLDLDNPEYTTPLGIAVSAGLCLLNDSYVVTLNGVPAKLFRNDSLTLRDVLLMNGYTYHDIMGRSGKNMSITLDGKHVLLRGELSTPAILKVNDEEAMINAAIHAGDRISFTPACSGADAAKTLGEVLGKEYVGPVLLNGREMPLDTKLQHGDAILTMNKPASAVQQPVQPVAPPVPVSAPVTPVVQPVATPVPVSAPANPVVQSVAPPAPAATQQEEAKPEETVSHIVKAKRLEVILNGKPLSLPGKESGLPYYLMDMLQYSGLDFDHLERPVRLAVNGQECGFRQVLKDMDTITICCE